MGTQIVVPLQFKSAQVLLLGAVQPGMRVRAPQLETGIAVTAVTSESTSSFETATAVDCTTSGARAKMPPKAAPKSYDGTLRQPTMVRHTPATSLPPTDSFSRDPFGELLYTVLILRQFN